MEPIFTMQYGEFAVVDYLSKEIRNTSVFIPASAQEKGIDLLLFRHLNGRNTIVTIQVKMSRTYYEHKKTVPYPYYLWFNRFTIHDNADWYILVGIYAKHLKKASARVKSTRWDTIMLALTHDEMVAFLTEVKQKKDSTKDDKMFGFGFDDTKQIFQTRGYLHHRDMSQYLIENRLVEIENTFK